MWTIFRSVRSKHLTTVCFLVAAVLFAALPAGATPPVFNGSVVNPVGGTITTQITGPASLCANSSGVITNSGCPHPYIATSAANLQSQINAAEAAGACVYVMPGNYNLGATSLTGSNKFCLECDASSFATTIHGTANPVVSITETENSYGVQEPYINGCYFYGGSTSTVLSFTNSVAASSNAPAYIVNSLFDGGSQSTGAAVVSTTLTANVNFINDYVFCNARVSGSIGFDFLGTTSDSVINSQVHQCDTGIGSAKSGSVQVANGVIKGVQFFGDNSDFNLAGNFNFSITGNVDMGCLKQCIIVAGTGQNAIIGNSVYDEAPAASHYGAIDIEGVGASVIGNVITQDFANNDCVTLNLTAGDGDNLVSGNNCNEIPSVGWYDVFAVGQFAATGNIISGNTINSAGPCNDVATCVSIYSGLIAASYGYDPAVVIKDNIGDSTSLATGVGALNPVGSVSCPTLASATWEWNPTPYEITEYISGGTVTQIETASPSRSGGAGTAVITGLTSGSVTLYPGQAINITYSVAPTVACIAR